MFLLINSKKTFEETYENMVNHAYKISSSHKSTYPKKSLLLKLKKQKDNHGVYQDYLFCALRYYSMFDTFIIEAKKILEKLKFIEMNLFLDKKEKDNNKVLLFEYHAFLKKGIYKLITIKTKCEELLTLSDHYLKKLKSQTNTEDACSNLTFKGLRRENLDTIHSYFNASFSSISLDFEKYYPTIHSIDPKFLKKMIRLVSYKKISLHKIIEKRLSKLEQVLKSHRDFLEEDKNLLEVFEQNLISVQSGLTCEKLELEIAKIVTTGMLTFSQKARLASSL